MFRAVTSPSPVIRSFIAVVSAAMVILASAASAPPVAAVAVTPLATDTFSRVVASGWGTLDTGQSWYVTNGNDAATSVGSGVGHMVHSATGQFLSELKARVLGFSEADIDISAKFVAESAANDPTGDVQFILYSRYEPEPSFRYYLRLVLDFSNEAATPLLRVDRQAITYTEGIANGVVAGANDPTQPWMLRFETVGDRILGKAWLAGTTEPAAWQIDTTDNQVTSPNQFAVATYTNDVTPAMTIDVDDVQVLPAADTSPVDTTYVPIDPVRLLDTRTGNGLSGYFLNRDPRAFQITGRDGIPSAAVAVTGNLTVTGQTTNGYVFLGPSATSTPTSSTLNFPVGDNRANGVTVALSSTGYLSAVFAGANSSAKTHLVFDVTGYFLPDTTGSTYFGVSPKRLVDTRSALGLATKLAANTPQSFTVAGQQGLPANAVAVTGNLTVTNQTSKGYFFVGPTASATPTSSTLNFPVGDNRANNVTVALSGTGKLGIVYAAPAGNHADAIFDVTGYFLADTSGLKYVSLVPVRVLDSRVGTGLSGVFATQTPRSWKVAGVGTVPADAEAVTVNLTVTQQSSKGYLALETTPAAIPTTSTLNFPVGDNRANGATALLVSGNCTIDFVGLPSSTTHVVMDVEGYYH